MQRILNDGNDVVAGAGRATVDVILNGVQRSEESKTAAPVGGLDSSLRSE